MEPGKESQSLYYQLILLAENDKSKPILRDEKHIVRTMEYARISMRIAVVPELFRLGVQFQVFQCTPFDSSMNNYCDNLELREYSIEYNLL